MIKNVDKWRRWEEGFRRRNPPDSFHNLDVFEELYEEAKTLGVLPRKEPLEGMEFKKRLARMLNVSGTVGEDGADTRSTYPGQRENK